LYDVAILYGLFIGTRDVEGIQEYFDRKFACRFVVYVEREPLGWAQERLSQADFVDVVVTNNAAKKAKKHFRASSNAFLAPLDEFGKRGMERDPC